MDTLQISSEPGDYIVEPEDIFRSVRRSLIYRPGESSAAAFDGGVAEWIGSIRTSQKGIGLGLGLPWPPQIRWCKGELIGCGAFGYVYMRMNLDSGELVAVKKVLIRTNNASK